MKSNRSIVFATALALIVAALLFRWTRLLQVRRANLGPAASQQAHEIQLWHCGMHPQVIQDHPGNCPICHMPLSPFHEHTSPGSQGSDGPSVTIDPGVVQNMGVRTARVVRGPLDVTIRTFGMLNVPQPSVREVSLRVGGWVEKLYADTDGMHVHQGEVLFDLYSPELQIAGQELILAVRARQALGADAGDLTKKEGDDLVASAKRKLGLWGVAENDITAIASAQRAPKSVPFRSPSDGDIIEKTIVEGSAVQPGSKLMRIEDHSHLWLDAEVYEDQLPLVTLGAKIEATVDGAPGKTLTGTVEFIYPHLDHMSRTELVRSTVENPDMALKPGMYASVQIKARVTGDALLAPRQAVIDTGTRKLVFIEESEGHFSPRVVVTGSFASDDLVQILKGLTAGETVVTSGAFLMDVESRTNEAIEKFKSSKSAPPASSSPSSGGTP